MQCIEHSYLYASSIPPGESDGAFLLWRKERLKDLYVNNTFLSFDNLKFKIGLRGGMVA